MESIIRQVADRFNDQLNAAAFLAAEAGQGIEVVMHPLSTNAFWVEDCALNTTYEIRTEDLWTITRTSDVPAGQVAYYPNGKSA